jgi:class 3 adenylate cyclase
VHVPTFLDRHDVEGVTPEAVAGAHFRDLEQQEKYGVHYHTYWFDPDQGTVFCLAEGPNKQALEDVHRESHGLIASNIVELGSTEPLNNIMGSLPSFPVGTAYVAPAMRAIVFTDICGSVAQVQQLGDDGHMAQLEEHNRIVREELAANDGREVKHTGDGIMAAFTSVVASVRFAIAVQRRLIEWNASAEAPFEVSIGISAGEPVTDDNDDLFGAAVQLAARLCAVGGARTIVTSSAVKELCMGKPITFAACELRELKGMDEPVATYAVGWDAA